MTRTGRPPKPEGEARDVTFRWRITKDEKQRLLQAAADNGETPSQYLRRIVLPK